MAQTPSLVEENRLKAQGYRRIAGIDEVGRGALAGPVVAAAVILPTQTSYPWLRQVRDSKLLTPAKRQWLSDHIRKAAVAIGIGAVPHQKIDTCGIVPATRLAMKIAIEQISPAPDSLLIDYLRLPGIPLPQRGITNGDGKCLSIACASIIAKVFRDQMMVEIDSVYPGYGLARHKGYGTKQHLACLRQLGPCPIHRRSFQPVRVIIEQ